MYAFKLIKKNIDKDSHNRNDNCGCNERNPSHISTLIHASLSLLSLFGSLRSVLPLELFHLHSILLLLGGGPLPLQLLLLPFPFTRLDLALFVAGQRESPLSQFLTSDLCPPRLAATVDFDLLLALVRVGTGSHVTIRNASVATGILKRQKFVKSKQNSSPLHFHYE